MSADKYDVMLTYLSEKGSGTFADLKRAWRWLAGIEKGESDGAWIVARDLASLGHIEMSWGDEMRWCAAPPFVTMVPRSGGRVFVTGARTRHFEAALSQHVEDEDLDLWLDRCEQTKGPASLYVSCKTHLDAEELASRLGIQYTYQVAEQIAGLLPPLKRYVDLFRSGELPRGLEAQVFDARSVGWTDTPSATRPGLYRCRTYSGDVYALRWATGQWQRVVKEYGIYEVLRWEEASVLEYAAGTHSLTLPVHAPLPALHARAATLCSGRLPQVKWAVRQKPGETSHRVRVSDFDRKSVPMLIYPNVAPAVAERIADSLAQQLKETAS